MRLKTLIDFETIPKTKHRSTIYRLILPLAFLCLGVSNGAIPGKLLLYSSFVLVLVLSLSFSSRDLIRASILLFVLNGLMRRLAASESGYFTVNDILIFVPYFPIAILLVKNLKRFTFERRLLLLILPICLLALLNIQTSTPSISWGLINLIMAAILGQFAKRLIDDALLAFIIKVGIFSSGYVFYQKISLPEYDLGWCLSRRVNLIILESCTSSSTRLWGTMESAVNMASFLTVTFFLLAFRARNHISLLRRIMEMSIIFTAIFLTGTRTFLFIIPLVFLVTSYVFKTLSIPRFVFAASCVAFLVNLLPSFAVLFDYQNNWVTRLDIANLVGDQSLRDRVNLLGTFQEEVTTRNLYIGDGLGSRSRGSLAIDNGFLSLVLELGLPLTLLFLVYITYKLKNISSFQNPLVVQSWSVCIMLTIANFSYVVFTGPSSVYFWLFLFVIGRGKDFEETELQ